MNAAGLTKHAGGQATRLAGVLAVSTVVMLIAGVVAAATRQDDPRSASRALATPTIAPPSAPAPTVRDTTTMTVPPTSVASTSTMAAPAPARRSNGAFPDRRLERADLATVTTSSATTVRAWDTIHATFVVENLTAGEVDITHPSSCVTLGGLYFDGALVTQRAVCATVEVADRLGPRERRSYAIDVESRGDRGVAPEKDGRIDPGSYDLFVGLNVSGRDGPGGIVYASPVKIDVT